MGVSSLADPRIVSCPVRSLGDVGTSIADHGIVAAGSRLTQDGQRMGPAQGVTIDEALRMFTHNGAYASFEARFKGTFTEGKLADLVVLDREPREVVPEELHTLRAEMTVIDGRIVYTS